MKIALVHDMLVQEGGQERVLRALQEAFPKSPTYVLIYNKKNKKKFYSNKEIHTSFLQKMPGIERHYHWYLPLMAPAIEALDFKKFDLVISSSSSFAKGVVLPASTKHICYCHTPTRYLWSEAQDYVEDLKYPQIIKRVLPIYLSNLRSWDWQASQRVDKFFANSKIVKDRIYKYYGKDSEVIHPPVDIEKFYISSEPKKYYLTGGRLVSYKRFDVVVKAFNKLKMPLKIFGTGPEYAYLKKNAKPNIEFLKQITEDKKRELFAKSIAFINPQEEDFGITAVEAIASGRPVIAYKKGGALEIVKKGINGVFFNDQTWENLANTIIHFNENQFNAQEIKSTSERFHKQNFINQIKEKIL